MLCHCKGLTHNENDQCQQHGTAADEAIHWHADIGQQIAADQVTHDAADALRNRHADEDSPPGILPRE